MTLLSASSSPDKVAENKMRCCRHIPVLPKRKLARSHKNLTSAIQYLVSRNSAVYEIMMFRQEEHASMLCDLNGYDIGMANNIRHYRSVSVR